MSERVSEREQTSERKRATEKENGSEMNHTNLNQTKWANISGNNHTGKSVRKLKPMLCISKLGYAYQDLIISYFNKLSNLHYVNYTVFMHKTYTNSYLLYSEPIEQKERMNNCGFFNFLILEHGLPSALAHPPTINNNNSSINNNNHNSKSGTNATKLPTNDDHHQQLQQQHQPLIASIHRNGKSSTTPVANKAVAVPQINTKSTKKSSLTNGELNENLIEFSIIDSTDGETASHFASQTHSAIPDKATRNSIKQQKQTAAAAADLNVIRANKTVVALSILIQHLTTDVSVFSLRISVHRTRMNNSMHGADHNLVRIIQIKSNK